jgi:hypothetical protein
LKSGWGGKKRKKGHHWLNYLSSSQNCQKNLIHNWCVYGCCVIQQVLACSKKAHTHTRAPWALLALLPIYPMVVFFMPFYMCSFSSLWLCGFILMVVFSFCLSIFVAIQWLYTNTHTHTHIVVLYNKQTHTPCGCFIFALLSLWFFPLYGFMVVFFLPFYLCCVHTHVLSFWLFFLCFALHTHTHTHTHFLSLVLLCLTHTHTHTYFKELCFQRPKTSKWPKRKRMLLSCCTNVKNAPTLGVVCMGFPSTPCHTIATQGWSFTIILLCWC